MTSRNYLPTVPCFSFNRKNSRERKRERGREIFLLVHKIDTPREKELKTRKLFSSEEDTNMTSATTTTTFCQGLPTISARARCRPSSTQASVRSRGDRRRNQQKRNSSRRNSASRSENVLVRASRKGTLDQNDGGEATLLQQTGNNRKEEEEIEEEGKQTRSLQRQSSTSAQDSVVSRQVNASL